MFWIIAWIILTLVFAVMMWGDADWDRQHNEKSSGFTLPEVPTAIGVVLVVVMSGIGSALVLFVAGILLGSPGLWNAISMGQR